MLSADESGEGELPRFPDGQTAESLPVRLTEKWAHQQEKKNQGADAREGFRKALDQKIWEFWDASNQTYGAPRITSDLHNEGIFVDKKTVAKAMRRMGIEGISPRSWVPATTIQGKATHSIPGLVKRTWDTGELNKVWISDTTYLRTGEGWLYLCAIRDGHSRRVLGWAMDATHTTDLVERALRMAHTLRGKVPDGLVFTRIEEHSSPVLSSTGSARNSISISRWGVPGCVLITRWRSRSGRR